MRRGIKGGRYCVACLGGIVACSARCPRECIHATAMILIFPRFRENTDLIWHFHSYVMLQHSSTTTKKLVFEKNYHL